MPGRTGLLAPYDLELLWAASALIARLGSSSERITGITSGTLSEVPRRLGQEFSAFWSRQHDYPPGTIVEVLL